MKEQCMPAARKLPFHLIRHLEDVVTGSREIRNMLDALPYPRHLGTLDFDLSERRARNDRKLKSIFEHIFDKYSKDFSLIGDEVDLATGEIVVNNGHLQSLDDERDAGDLSDEDPLGLDQINDSNAGLIATTVKRKIADASTRRPHTSAGKPPSPLPRIFNLRRPDDQSIEPIWRVPRLPSDDVSIQDVRSSDPLTLEAEEAVESPSPPNHSVWAGLSLSKRRPDDVVSPRAKKRRRRVVVWTPDAGATAVSPTRRRRPAQRRDGSPYAHSTASAESRISKREGRRKPWSSAEDGLLVSLKLSSLRGRKLYLQAFPERKITSIHYRWHYLTHYTPEKVKRHADKRVPEHLRSLHTGLAGNKLRNRQSEKFARIGLVNGGTPPVSSLQTIQNRGKTSFIQQPVVEVPLPNTHIDYDHQSIAQNGATATRNAIVPDSQEEEDLQLLNITGTNEVPDCHVQTEANHAQEAEAILMPSTAEEPSVNAHAPDFESEPLSEPHYLLESSPRTSHQSRHHMDEDDQEDDRVIRDDTCHEPTSVSIHATLDEDHSREPQEKSPQSIAADPYGARTLQTTSRIIPNSSASTKNDALQANHARTLDVSPPKTPDLGISVTKSDAQNHHMPSSNSRKPKYSTASTKRTVAIRPLKDAIQNTPTRSLAPKTPWKKPTPSEKRKTVTVRQALDLDSDDELTSAQTIVTREVIGVHSIKAVKSGLWEQKMVERRKSSPVGRLNHGCGKKTYTYEPEEDGV